MDPNHVTRLYFDRLMTRSGWRRMATQIRDAAEGQLTVPLPEVDANESVAVANLIVQGIDQTGSRIASTTPYTRFFPERPGQHASENRARTRGAALKSLHIGNAMGLLDRRRARWFVAYGTAPVIIRPIDGKIVWEPRDPLSCFSAPSADPDAMMSDNCVFAMQRPLWWLIQHYPQAASMLRRPRNMGESENITVLEYIDCDTWGLYAAAPNADVKTFERNHGESYGGGATPGINHSGPQVYGRKKESDEWVGSEHAVTLIETPNRTGLCPIVNPQRICLGQVTGQFDQMVGIYAQQAKLMALEIDAVTESVYPPLWAIQNQNEQLEIVTVADGKRGVVGEVRGGTLQPIQLAPGFQTYPTIDRLERTQRLNGGIPADYDGSTQTHVSGSRGQQVMSAVIDFPIQEAQECFARSRWHENIVAIAVGKANFGAKQFNFGPSFKARGAATWTFDGLFPDEASTAHVVTFPFPGADINGALIRTGQKLGLALISKQTAREDDPEIDDPEVEKDRIDAEALEDALRTAIQQQAASGAIDPASVARIVQLVLSDRKDLAEAVMQVQQEAQALQASQAPPGAPETQPGLSPATPTAQPAGGPPAALDQFTQDLGALRLGQRSSPQEKRAEQSLAISGAQ